jgi:hypothetical protein
MMTIVEPVSKCLFIIHTFSTNLIFSSRNCRFKTKKTALFKIFLAYIQICIVARPQFAKNGPRPKHLKSVRPTSQNHGHWLKNRCPSIFTERGDRIQGMNMNSDPSGNFNKAQTFCSNCHKTIKKGEAYHYHISVLCEDCLIDTYTPYVRKTHWQYLGSIKADYLRVGRTD